MKTLHLFQAGSIYIKEEQNTAKEAVREINKINARRGRRVQYELKNFRDFHQHNQQSFDRYIEEQADVVVFIIRDQLGDKTLQEMRLAAEKKKKNRKFQIMVYVHSFEDKTPEIEAMEQHLEEIFGAGYYYTAYNNTEHLYALMRNWLSEAMDVAAPTHKYIRATLLGATVLVGVLLGVIALLMHNQFSKHVLFVGGSSAAHYIEYHYPQANVKQYTRGLYMPIATGTALQLLGESTKWDRKQGISWTIQFYPICLAADRAVDRNFLNAMETAADMTDYGNIIELKLGEETIEVALHPTPAIVRYLQHEQDSLITTAELAYLLRNAAAYSIHPFATSPTSGTRTNYRRALGADSTLLLSGNITEYRSGTSDGQLNEKRQNFLVLASECYFPSCLNKKDCTPHLRLKLCEAGNLKHIYRKYIALYFVGYHWDNSAGDHRLTIPHSTIAYLRKLGVNTDVIYDGQTVPRYPDQLILHYPDDLRSPK